MAFTRSPISVVITDATGNTINLGNASGAFTSAPLSVVVTDQNGNTLNIGPGVVAKYDATAQGANIGSTVLYTVPAGQGGMYRMSAYLVLTQVATTSSTLPQVGVTWTDVDTNVGEGNYIFGTAPTGNTLGLLGMTNNQTPFSFTFNAKAGTNISFQTFNYASVGATPMQFAVHIKLEYLGA